MENNKNVIQKEIDSISEYFIGLRYVKGKKVVDTKLKENWKILPSETILHQKGSSDPGYFMFFTENNISLDTHTISFDDIIDYIKEVISYNLEKEKKDELLKIKKEELAELFKNKSLSELEKLNFLIEGDSPKELDPNLKTN